MKGKQKNSILVSASPLHRGHCADLYFLHSMLGHCRIWLRYDREGNREIPEFRNLILYGKAGVRVPLHQRTPV
jgi:hypothetical protein